MTIRQDSVIRYLRFSVIIILGILFVPIVSGFFTATNISTTPSGAFSQADPVNVVTIDAAGPGQIIAFGEGWKPFYRDRKYPIYHDVDPDPPVSTTVLYVASQPLVASACPTDEECVLNVVERLNLVNGATRRLYSEKTPKNGSTQIHDVDRVNRSVILVADIGPPDRVYMMNISTEEIIWEWRVSQAYPPKSGGQFPGDWTHLNDVSYLPDGRVMVNLRNHDQVVFIEPGNGILESWTLGCDDCHETLYEPHNPDYIPRDQGGPAILIADSENNRIVEYQWTGTNWTRSWLWSDDRLQWPRDADRLPNGDTIIVDSHGQRLLRVGPGGEIVQQRSFPDGGYDIENLNTGDESSGGPSMEALRQNSSVKVESTVRAQRVCQAIPNTLPECISYSFISSVPSIILHGILFVLPSWVPPLGGAAVVYQAGVGVLWLTMEIAIYNLGNCPR